MNSRYPARSCVSVSGGSSLVWAGGGAGPLLLRRFAMSAPLVMGPERDAPAVTRRGLPFGMTSLIAHARHLTAGLPEGTRAGEVPDIWPGGGGCLVPALYVMILADRAARICTEQHVPDKSLWKTPMNTDACLSAALSTGKPAPVRAFSTGNSHRGLDMWTMLRSPGAVQRDQSRAQRTLSGRSSG